MITIAGLHIYIPDKLESNFQLSQKFPEWNFEKIVSKTGVLSRSISDQNQFAEDLGIKASIGLMKSSQLSSDDIDAVICITQTSKRKFPGPSYRIHNELSLRSNILCLDINQGCSGFVTGLFAAHSIINGSSIRSVLLVTCDNYQKIIDNDDRSTRALFGEAASATLVKNTTDSNCHSIIGFEFFSDGSGCDSLYAEYVNGSSNMNSLRLYMNGPEVLLFSMREVPKTIHRLLERLSLTIDSIDLFVFHQGSALILDQLQKSMSIPSEKLVRNFERIGNTSSTTIPICIASEEFRSTVKDDDLVLLVGFGVGLSVSCCLMKW